MNFFTAHGGRGNEGTMQIDGMNVGSAFNGGGVPASATDTANAAEIQVTVAGGLGETDRGGPAFNMIPKTGGNTFSGTGFRSYAGEWSQGDNLDDELQRLRHHRRARAASRTGTAASRSAARSCATGCGSSATCARFGTQQRRARPLRQHERRRSPNVDLRRGSRACQARNANAKMIAAIRLTGQATPRNKLGFYLDYQKNCTGSSYAKDGEQCRERGDDWIALGASAASTAARPESGNVWDDREKIIQASWTSPVTNKLLLEAGFSSFDSRWGGTILRRAR